MNTRQDIKQAINDLIQAKRQAMSDGQNAAQTLLRAAKYRDDAQRLLNQAQELELNATNWKVRYQAFDKQIQELRIELAAAEKQAEVKACQKTIDLLESLDPATLELLGNQQPDLMPIIQLLKELKNATA